MKRILVIDDDAEILLSMKALLSTRNYEVETVRKWENTFVTIEVFKPDLILLDYFLSGNTGDRICKEIKKGTPHIPILIFSANLKNNKDYGADDFIEKPFDANDMFTRINTLINNN